MSCKNNCGFYGTEDQQGYCSTCYQTIATFKRNSSIFSTIEKKQRSKSENKSSSVPSYASSSFKNILLPSSSTPLYSKKESSRENEDVKRFEHCYRKSFSGCAEDVKKTLFTMSKNFCLEVSKILKKKPVDEFPVLFADLFKKLEKGIYNYQSLRDNPIELKNQFVDFVEDFSMSCLYNKILAIYVAKHESDDLKIEQQIRSLNWINVHHLDSAIDVSVLKVRQHIGSAIRFLADIDREKTAKEKLETIRKCCTEIRAMLSVDSENPLNADQFLPALIFIVLKTNPNRLISNIRFVQGVCNENRAMKGEYNYLFTSLLCAVSFIENISASNLNISEREFENYCSGKLRSIDAWTSTLALCRLFEKIDKGVEIGHKLDAQIDDMENQSRELKNNIDSFKDDIRKQISEIRNRAPLKLENYFKLTSKKTLATNQEMKFDRTADDNGRFYEKNLKLHIEKKTTEMSKTKENSSMILSRIGGGGSSDQEAATNSGANEYLFSLSNLDSISLLSNNESIDYLNVNDDGGGGGTSHNNDDVNNESKTSLNEMNGICKSKSPVTKHTDNNDDNNDNDNLSVISAASTSSNANNSKLLQHYVGFSRQGSRIPTISCNRHSKNIPAISPNPKNL